MFLALKMDVDLCKRWSTGRSMSQRFPRKSRNYDLDRLRCIVREVGESYATCGTMRYSIFIRFCTITTYASSPHTFVCDQEYPSTLSTGTIIQSIVWAKFRMAEFLDVNSSFKKNVTVAGAIHSRAWIAASTRTTGLPYFIWRSFY